MLAHHFAEADDPKRAARYLLEAGNAARSLYADEEAIAYYRRALSFLDRLGEAHTARAVLFKIALAHHLAFDFEAADAAWAEAFTRPEPRPVWLDRTERVETSLLRPENWVPGHGYDIIRWSLGTNLFRGLLGLEPGLDVVPDLAKHVSVSADGCTYMFRLRDGLCWSDGERLTAHDFAFTYRAMREQEVNSAHLLEGVEAHAKDEVTLELRLHEPRAHMLYLFAQLPFFPWPRHKVETLGPAWHEAAAPVGNGPFVLERSDERAVLLRNRFWPESRSNVAEVSIATLDRHEALDEWRAGRFDFLLFSDPSLVDGAADTTIVPIALLGVRFMGFFAQAPFDDVRVRRALAHGLDRALLVERSPDAPAHGGFLPPAMPGHSHELAPKYDVELARSLLAEAGYPDGRGLPELRLIHDDPGLGERVHREEEEARWDSQWRELGVRVRQEWLAFDQRSAEAQVGPALWESGWASDYPDPHGLLGTFLESQSSWLPRDEELLGLIERARSLRARDERLELYRAADSRLVAERVQVVPTFYHRWDVLHRTCVDGIWGHPSGLGPLDRVVVRRPA